MMKSIYFIIILCISSFAFAQDEAVTAKSICTKKYNIYKQFLKNKQCPYTKHDLKSNGNFSLNIVCKTQKPVKLKPSKMNENLLADNPFRYKKIDGQVVDIFPLNFTKVNINYENGKCVVEIERPRKIDNLNKNSKPQFVIDKLVYDGDINLSGDDPIGSIINSTEKKKADKKATTVD